MQLEKRYIPPIPFHTDPNEGVRYTVECEDEECPFAQKSRNDRLPAFYITRPTDVGTITSMIVECLDGTDQQVIQISGFASSFISAVSSDDQNAIETSGPNNGDCYLITSEGSAVNEWREHVGERACWNAGVWEYSSYNDCDYLANDDGDIWRQLNGSWYRMGKTLFHEREVNGLDYFVWYCCDLDIVLNCGVKRIVVTDGTTTWYSEPIEVKDIDNDPLRYIEAKWRNSCDIVNFPYTVFENYYNCLIVDDENAIGLPTYPITEENDTDTKGNNKILYRNQRKQYNLQPREVPEYLVDIYHSWLLHDDVQLNIPRIGEYHPVETDTLEVQDPEWDTHGCYADVSIDFTYQADAIKTGCCDSLPFYDCEYYKDTGLLPDKNVIRTALQNEQSAIETAGPVVGDCYVIKWSAGSSTNWINHINSIACWNGSGWDYTVPSNLDYVYTTNEGYYMYDQGFWLPWGSPFIISTSAFTIEVKSLYLGNVGTSVRLQYKLSSDTTWITWNEWVDTIDEDPVLFFASKSETITGLVDCRFYDIRIQIFNKNCPVINTGPTVQAFTDSGVC